MCRVDAMSGSAQVVDLEAVGDWFSEVLVTPAVNQYVFPVDPNLTVAFVD